jgi:type II secretory pathway pseudopilin PulG
MQTKKSIKSLVTTTILFSIVFVCLLILSNLSVNTDILTLITFFVYLIYLYSREKKLILYFSYIIIYMLSNVYGVFAIENNQLYLTELSTYGYRAGALLPITFIHFIFIQTLLFMFVLKPIKFPEINNRFTEFWNGRKISNIQLSKYFCWIIILLTLIMFAKVINKPAFLMGYDRFIYASLFLGGIWDKLIVLLVLVLPVALIPFLKAKSKLSIFTIGFAFLYLFWIGNKFGYYIIIAYTFSLPFVYLMKEKNVKKIVLLGLLLGITLFGLISFQSKVVYNRDSRQNIEYINQRIAQQGQLWWKTYALTKNTPNKFNELSDETSLYFQSNPTVESAKNYGIFKIMRLTTPSELFQAKVFNLHSRYAYSSQSSIYYYFKMPGLIIYTIISAIAYYLIIFSLIKSLLMLRIIDVILYNRLFTVFNGVLLQSDFDKLFSFEIILVLLVLLFSNLMRRSSSHKENFSSIEKVELLEETARKSISNNR